MAKTTVTPDGTVTVDTGAEPAAKATWDGETVNGALIKAVDEEQFTLSVAYPANRADVAVAQDGHRDFAAKAAVQEAAWNYLRKSRNVGLMHVDGTDGSGEVVESYTWPGDDWTTATGYVVKRGDWLLGVVWDEDAWSMIKNGDITGVSMQGSARRRTPTAEAIAALRS